MFVYSTQVAVAAMDVYRRDIVRSWSFWIWAGNGLVGFDLDIPLLWQLEISQKGFGF